MIISLKEITNTTDVVFFVIAILLLVINIVLNIRNFFVIKSSQNKVDNSNCTFDFTFWSNIPPTFFAYLVISSVADNAKNTYTFIVNESKMRKQKEQLLQSNEYRWAQAIDDLTLFKNILGEKNQLIADLYREKSELKDANKELDEVIKTQAKQIEELNAKLNPDKHVHSQEQGMYPTL